MEKQGNNSSHRPQLSDLRDSGSIEQDADCVLFLYRDSYYASQNPDGAEVDADTAECIVAKNRHGEMKLRKAFAAQGIPFWVESFTNQQFVILTDAQKETLEKRYIFEPMGKSADGGNIARFCTSWATTEEEVQTLIDDLKAL